MPRTLCRTSSALRTASVAGARGGEITGGKDEVTDAGHEGLYIPRTCESRKQGQILLPRVCARATFSSHLRKTFARLFANRLLLPRAKYIRCIVAELCNIDSRHI